MGKQHLSRDERLIQKGRLIGTRENMDVVAMVLLDKMGFHVAVVPDDAPLPTGVLPEEDVEPKGGQSGAVMLPAHGLSARDLHTGAEGAGFGAALGVVVQIHGLFHGKQQLGQAGKGNSQAGLRAVEVADRALIFISCDGDEISGVRHRDEMGIWGLHTVHSFQSMV